MTACRKP